MMQDIYLKDAIKKQKKIGAIRKTKSGIVYRKNVIRNDTPSRKGHYMRIVQGYGIQKEVFDKYLRGKKGRIEIKEVDTGRFLVASIKTWTEHSRAGNYGDGKQIFLSERFMHGTDNFSRIEVSNEIISFDTRLRLKEIAEEKGIFKSR